MKTRLFFLWHAGLALHALAQSRETPPPSQYDEAIDRGDYGLSPTHPFKTFQGHIRTPVVNFLQWSPVCNDGLRYFLTPRGYSFKNKTGPMILDSRGELIWTHHYENIGSQPYNFRIQPYRRKDHLTFWIGEDRVKGHGAGHDYILNSSYDVVKKVEGAQWLWPDLHEFVITRENTALVSAYDIVHSDVTMMRTFDPNDPEDQDSNYVWDSVVQEIGLRRGKLRWQWRAGDYINITDTYRPINKDGTKKNPFDWFHLNSVQKDELGNYLVSARFLHSILYIDGRTKEIIWRLGGKRNSFMDMSGGNAINFAWQHDAQLHPSDTFPVLYTPPLRRPGFTTKLLTLFDNASENQHYKYGHSVSRGMVLELTYPTPGTKAAQVGPQRFPSQASLSDKHLLPGLSDLDMEKVKAINGTDPSYTVRLIKSYENPQRVQTSSQGNMQLLPQGSGRDPKILIGWGLAAAWTEFDSNGTVLCDAHFGARTSFETGEVHSYRVFKFPWTGKPKSKPKLVVADRHMYFSWIGATDIAKWSVQFSRSQDQEEMAWEEALTIPKTHFEERVPIPWSMGSARCVRVIALDENGAHMENGVSDLVDRGFWASSLDLMYLQVARDGFSWILLEIGVILICPVIVYDTYRRCLRERRDWTDSAETF